MIWHFAQCDPEYGRRVAEGLKMEVPAEDPAYGYDEADRENNRPHGAPIGTAGTAEAAQQAGQQGHTGQPY